MLKLGRRRPIVSCPRLSLRNYLLRSLPPPPVSTSYWAQASDALSKVYLNDQLGDCVIAGMQHAIGVMTGNSGPVPAIFDDVNTKRLYHAIGGYVDGDVSTDNGCDEQTALNYWKQSGLLPDGSYKIAGWAAIDATNIVETKTALWLFENVIFGVELPNEWLDPPGDGFVWDIAGPANPDNGHCFLGVDYTEDGIIIDSWGLQGMITWQAVQRYAAKPLEGELYTAFGPDAISKATQRAPNGFDQTQLLADLQAIGG